MKVDMKLSYRASLSGDDPEKLTQKQSLPPPDPVEDTRETCVEKYTSCRWVIGYMCCVARFAQSAIRQCIGLAVVCMTLQAGARRPESSPATSDVLKDNGTQVVAEFVWSPQFEGLILNGFNIGFLFSPILGGHIAGRFGGKRVVAVALLGGGLTTILLPTAARYNAVLVVILRMVGGTFLGALDPATQALWAKWAPKHEKAQLTTCSYTGLSLAGVLTFFLSGYLCGIEVDNGWPFIFYFFGVFALLCLPPWLLLVYDSPAQHPRILDKEVAVISRGKPPTETKKKTVKTPWRGMLTSSAFWAILVAHVTYTWVTSWLMSYLPKYLKQTMKFDVKEDGLYSSLPYVGRLVSGFVAGYLSDLCTRRGYFTTANTRKLFQVIGCLGCAVCMQLVGFLDHTWRGAAVALLVFAMSFQNLTSVAFRINHLDIAPRFAGVMMGMTVTAAMVISLSGPPITAAIINTKATDGASSLEAWLVMFSIVAVLNVLGAVIFALFAQGTVQDWATESKDNDDLFHGVTVDGSSGDAIGQEKSLSKKDSLSKTASLSSVNVVGEATVSSEMSGKPRAGSNTDSGNSSGDEGDSKCSDDDARSSSAEAVVSTAAHAETVRDPKLITERVGSKPLMKRPLSKTLSLPPGLASKFVQKQNVLRKRISSSDLQNQGKEGKAERQSTLNDVQEGKASMNHAEESTKM